MNVIIFLSALLFSSLTVETHPPAEPGLVGTWTATYTDESGTEMQLVAILTDLYFSSTSFSKSDGKFGMTQGGYYTVKDKTMSMFFEFNSADASMVGTTSEMQFSLDGDTFQFADDPLVWKRVDHGQPGALAGAWLITGRKQGNELRTMTPGARKTMKILSGTWFQWIAFNSDTGEFFGTGGGKYITKDGKYTEIIEFFSRDDSRVGASLQFDYEVKDGQWHHSGLSSRGEPIYEIWSPRTPAL